MMRNTTFGNHIPSLLYLRFRSRSEVQIRLKSFSRRVICAYSVYPSEGVLRRQILAMVAKTDQPILGTGSRKERGLGASSLSVYRATSDA